MKYTHRYWEIGLQHLLKGKDSTHATLVPVKSHEDAPKGVRGEMELL